MFFISFGNILRNAMMLLMIGKNGKTRRSVNTPRVFYVEKTSK